MAWILPVQCVPNEPPGGQATDAAPERPHTNSNPLAAPRGLRRAPEMTPWKVATSAHPADASPPLPPAARLTAPFHDDFERATLGSDWFATSDAWRIVDGRLCAKGARNHPVWLRRRLPVNARVQFSARSLSPEGDLKFEIFGDGKSTSRSVTYDHATSYVGILGGWKNRIHALARLDEHGNDRKELRVDPESQDVRLQPVVPQKTYRFLVERQDGRTVRWQVDSVDWLRFEDDSPLTGLGHEYFAFNDWAAEVCFDDLSITPLSD